ncbi:hypothetical protein L5515_017026 [Caenorhabditis briggsae]|uniref:Uncharacterized protein n=1 Tax=Caenorhabditis briggsae TaxID=6238 RepID=A0AAE9JPI5_CAEBR|nr:hypothetical protein L5515_017026 [Caenorhabditis briggsae]
MSNFVLPNCGAGSSLCAEVPQSAFVFQQDSAEDKSSWGHQSVGYGELEVEDKTENVVEETNTFFNKMGHPSIKKLRGVVTWSSPKLISTISCRVNENLPMVHYKIEKFSVPRKTDLHKSSGIFTGTL